jgi:hypothetical protein
MQEVTVTEVQKHQYPYTFAGVLPEPAQTPLARALAFSKAITGRTVLIVDNSNLWKGREGKEFCPDMGTPVFTHLGGDELISASMVVSTADRPSQIGYYRFLESRGWDIYRHATLTSTTRHIFENEAAVDGGVRALIRAAASSRDVDSIVLFSGDGGNTNAVKEARRAGKNVFVLAWDLTLNPALASACTDHITIETMRPLIARVLH